MRACRCRLLLRRTRSCLLLAPAFLLLLRRPPNDAGRGNDHPHPHPHPHPRPSQRRQSSLSHLFPTSTLLFPVHSPLLLILLSSFSPPSQSPAPVAAESSSSSEAADSEGTHQRAPGQSSHAHFGLTVASQRLTAVPLGSQQPATFAPGLRQRCIRFAR